MLAAVYAGEDRRMRAAGAPGVLRRLAATVFAGDPRVWAIAALCAAPLVAFVCIYCAQPRDYDTGTDSVSASAFAAHTSAGQRLCVPGLLLPAHTARLRLRMAAPASERPALRMTLQAAGRTLQSRLAPVRVTGSRVSTAVFPVPELPVQGAAATMCVSALGPVAWGGTALPTPPAQDPPTIDGRALSGRIAVWYLPRAGSRRSYFSAASAVLARAALFRGIGVGAWTYVFLLAVLAPLLALGAVRLLALAAAGRAPRHAGAWLWTLAALNFAMWALITPAFQAPDEVDHFAYTQSLVARGKAPSQQASVQLRRWSSAETLALEGVDFFTDHRSADARPPWLAADERRYDALTRSLHPAAGDGGGKETAATHGPVYYGLLAPAYALGGSSPFAQLTLMRLASALIGALTVLLTFMLARELAPGRAWLAVLAALFVAYQPMYGFISGSVNNDVGVNALAAAVELLLIRIVRRGLTPLTGALAGAGLAALPFVKGTGMSLYPLAAVLILVVLWRDRAQLSRSSWLSLLLAGAVTAGLLALLGSELRPAVAAGSAIGSNASAVGGALDHIPDFLAYLWQTFLPRLPFMTRHFAPSPYPALGIFSERGWAAFGSYTVLFHYWVYLVISGAMVAVLVMALLAARRERAWIGRHRLEVAAVLAMPVVVLVGFEAAYYSPLLVPAFGQAGRYMFPAIAPLALLAVGATHAFGRRWALGIGVVLLVVLIAFCYASQLLTLTTFYA